MYLGYNFVIKFLNITKYNFFLKLLPKTKKHRSELKSAKNEFSYYKILLIRHSQQSQLWSKLGGGGGLQSEFILYCRLIWDSYIQSRERWNIWIEAFYRDFSIFRILIFLFNLRSPQVLLCMYKYRHLKSL